MKAFPKNNLVSAKSVKTTRRKKMTNPSAIAILLTLGLCCVVMIMNRPIFSQEIHRIMQHDNRDDQDHSHHPPHHLPSTLWWTKTHDHCITPELIGEWKSVDRNLPRNHFNAPHCCPNDFDDMHLLTDDSKDFCKIPDLIKPGGHACRCLPGTERYQTLDNSLTWSSSHLPSWDARKSCQTLKNRRILLLGDSTMNQVAAVLSGAFHEGGCGKNIQFAYADTLIDREMGAMNRGDHWLTMVDKEYNFPDVVIIGVGAHIHTEANFTIATDEIVDNILFLRESHPEVTVVWKTISPAGCTDKPSTVHPLDAGLNYEVEPNNWDYWAHFYDRDTKMVKIMVDLGVPILDSRMLYGRPDAHIGDCIHFCLPGPLDIMPPLVQKLLESEFESPTCVNFHK